MAMKCPECGTTAHTRTSEYQTGTLKKTWYQCRNIDCSCTFITLESLDAIIMKPQKADAAPEPEKPALRLPQALGRYGTACTRRDRHAQPWTGENMNTQLTEAELNATGACIAAAMNTGNKPLQTAGWLLKLPAAEAEKTTAQLVRAPSPGWRLRVADLMDRLSAWIEARRSETAAVNTLTTLRERRSEAAQEAEAGRARFRTPLEQNSGAVTAEMKKLRAAYLEQEETARELESVAREKEKQLPQLAHATGHKANAYVFYHEGITDERVDELLNDFLVLHGAELFSMLSMKHRQYSRTGGEYVPGMIAGVNDADTLYDSFVMQRIAEIGRNYDTLMFRDEVLSLTGITPAAGARSDRKKQKLI